MRRAVVVGALAALWGCAAEEAALRPADGGRGTAFYYEIEKDGRGWGDAKVWSPGAYELEDDKAVVEVHFRIRNDSDQALTFDLAGTYAEIGIDGSFSRVQPQSKQGPVEIRPGATEYVELLFALPPEADADDIDEFEVNWAVRTPAGRVTHSSLFLPLLTDRYVYYRPSFSLGFGYGYPYGYYRHRYWYDPWYW